MCRDDLDVARRQQRRDALGIIWIRPYERDGGQHYTVSDRDIPSAGESFTESALEDRHLRRGDGGHCAAVFGDDRWLASQNRWGSAAKNWRSNKPEEIL